MQKIPVKLAEPGMKLAKPVTRENGMVVLAGGLELTVSLISKLESMNVELIVVKGTPLNLGGGGDSSWAKKSERLAHLFRRYAKDKWMLRVQGFFREYFDWKAAAQEASAKAEITVEDTAVTENEEASKSVQNEEGK